MRLVFNPGMEKNVRLKARFLLRDEHAILIKQVIAYRDDCPETRSALAVGAQLNELAFLLDRKGQF